MTNNLDLERIQEEAFAAIDDLFNEEDNWLQDEDIFLLKEKILSLDWEYNEEEIKEILAILEKLKQKYLDKLHQILISMMSSIGKFLLVAKEEVPSETLNTFAYMVDFFARLYDPAFTKEQKKKCLVKIKKKYKDFKNAVAKIKKLQQERRDKLTIEPESQELEIQKEEKNFQKLEDVEQLEPEEIKESLEVEEVEIAPQVEFNQEIVALDGKQQKLTSDKDLEGEKSFLESTDKEEVVLDLEGNKEEPKEEVGEQIDEPKLAKAGEQKFELEPTEVIDQGLKQKIDRVELRELKETLIQLESNLEQKIILAFEKRLSRCEQLLLDVDDKLQKILGDRANHVQEDVKGEQHFEFEEELETEPKNNITLLKEVEDFEFEQNSVFGEKKAQVKNDADLEESYLPYVQVFSLGSTLVAFDTTLISNVYKISPKKGRAIYGQDVVKLREFQGLFTSLVKGMKGELSQRSNNELKQLDVNVFHYPVEIEADFQSAILVFLSKPVVFLVGKKIGDLFLPVKSIKEKGSVFKTKLFIPELGEVEYFDVKVEYVEIGG